MSGPPVSIAEYYADKCVFVTGATGFVGKVFVEKVLRCCPRVRAIYCLVRPKKGASGAQRLHDMFKEKCYERLRAEQPEFGEKVHAIQGDILEEEDLGIGEEDRQLLQDNVHIVIHSAATVRFTEHLRVAVRQNVVAVRQLITMCRSFRHLEAYIHVSTAFANCDRSYIEEKIYTPHIHAQKILDAFQWMDDSMIESITPALLRGLPNTYTLSKQLGEQVLLEEGAPYLPVAIVRPSIVTAAWKEPLPGWLDNFNGPNGLYVAFGKGLLHSFKGDPRSVADLIPVDFVANALVAAAWRTGTQHLCRIQCRAHGAAAAGPSHGAGAAGEKPPLPHAGCSRCSGEPRNMHNVEIYHMTSGEQNPLYWGDMSCMMSDLFQKYPMNDAWRHPCKAKPIITQYSMVHNYWLLVSHLMPAHLSDFCCRLVGKKPKMVNVYRRLHTAMSSLEFFTEQTWQWSQHNLDLLHCSMSPDDQKTFYLDTRKLHWPSYIESYVIGTKTFLLKEELSTVPAARAHLRKLRWVSYVVNTLALLAVYRLLIARSHLGHYTWHFFMGLFFKFVRFFNISSTIKRQ